MPCVVNLGWDCPGELSAEFQKLAYVVSNPARYFSALTGISAASAIMPYYQLKVIAERQLNENCSYLR